VGARRLLQLLLAPASSSGSWQQYAATWNSGSNTSATFQIFDLQTDNSVPGNDFAIDDIRIAAPQVVPALPGWGIAVLMTALVAAGAALLTRTKRAA